MLGMLCGTVTGWLEACGCAGKCTTGAASGVATAAGCAMAGGNTGAEVGGVGEAFGDCVGAVGLGTCASLRCLAFLAVLALRA